MYYLYSNKHARIEILGLSFLYKSFMKIKKIILSSSAAIKNKLSLLHAYWVTPADTPRWDLRRRNQKK